MPIRRAQEFRETWEQLTAPSLVLPFLAGMVVVAIPMAIVTALLGSELVLLLR